MANYSDFQSNLTGNPFNLRAAYDDFIRLTPWHFNISEIYEAEFVNTEPPSWIMSGSGRWGVEVDKLVSLAAEHNLSGTITDAESGSNFFIQAILIDGEIVDSVNDEYMSDTHYEHCPDNGWWYESYSYAIGEPEDYPEIIEFLTKHNIIPEESLNA